ncbi:conserved hypothetical protein, partial [Ricinus communis]
PGTSYEVFLPANGVKDYAGNAIGADFKSTFNTGNAAETTQNGSANAWTAPGIFGRDQSGGADDVFWGWLDNTGRLNLSVANAATNNPGTRSTSPVNDGNWHHVVLTRDAGSGAQTMYIDGAKTSSTGLTG